MSMRSQSKSLRSVLPRLVCFGILLATHTVSAETTYTDTEFDVANDWSVFGPYDVPESATGGAFSAQQGNGGNPHMEVTHTRAAVSSGEVFTWGMLINNTFVWDPAENADGPLGKIDMTMFVDGGGAWSLAVKQGEFVWYAIQRRAVLNLPDPVTIEIENMVELDFVPVPGSEFVVDNQPMHPDFSANAPPITFGVGIGRSCPATSNCTTNPQVVSLIDDLQITATSPVPLNAGHNGNWWNGPSRNGEGVQVEIADAGDGSLIFVATIYSYNDMGEQIFLIAVGPVDGNTAEVQVFITDGGVWGNDFDPNNVNESEWGTGAFISCDCGNLVMHLRPNTEFTGQGFSIVRNYKLVRLTTSLLPCPFEPEDPPN